VQAVAIQGAKIVAAGDDAAIEKMRGMGTKVINAGGKQKARRRSVSSPNSGCRSRKL